MCSLGCVRFNKRFGSPEVIDSRECLLQDEIFKQFLLLIKGLQWTSALFAFQSQLFSKVGSTKGAHQYATSFMKSWNKNFIVGACFFCLFFAKSLWRIFEHKSCKLHITHFSTIEIKLLWPFKPFHIKASKQTGAGSHMNRVGVLVVLIRVVNYGFLSHLGYKPVLVEVAFEETISATIP